MESTAVSKNQEKKNAQLEKELIEKNQSINKNFDYNKPEYKKYLDSMELADKNRVAGNVLYRGLNVGYYVAQPKNTLSQLAVLYGMPEEKIKALNNLTNDTLYANQKIKIDYDQRNPLVKGYIVKEGDTLEGIVKRFELSMPALLSINKLDGYVLSANMVIRFQDE